MHTLAGSIDDFYKTHAIVYYKLFSIGVLYRRVISLVRIVISDDMTANRGQAYFCERNGGECQGLDVKREEQGRLETELTNKAVQRELGGIDGCRMGGERGKEHTCTARAVLPTPPSPRTATLQLSILDEVCQRARTRERGGGTSEGIRRRGRKARVRIGRRVVRGSEIESRESSSSSSWGVVKRGAEGLVEDTAASQRTEKGGSPLNESVLFQVLPFRNIRIRPSSAQIPFAPDPAFASLPKGSLLRRTPFPLHTIRPFLARTVCSRDRPKFSKQWTPFSAHSFPLHDPATHRPPCP
jgi:hypothetical protein